jgi:ribose transport system ATP-binding protein
VNTQTAEAPPVVPALSLVGISKNYAGVAALSDVSLEVLPGEVHALLGENGAGKSTLMNVASGTVQPDAGVIGCGGEIVTDLDPARAAELGIAIVHQHPAVLPDLTIEENLRVALPSSVFASGNPHDIATGILEGVGLSVHLQDRVETLSVAQKHLLEIAKALAIRPALLVLDEPTAPLDQDSVDLLFSRVREIVALGTAVVYITHRLAEVREIADRVTVLRDGRVRGTAVVGDISDHELLALIVGRQLDSAFPPKHAGSEDDPEMLEVSHLTGEGFADVSFAARRGAIVGVAGVVGNGQADLLKALAGLQASTGDVVVAGTKRTAGELLHGAAYMPADRHREGLMMDLGVRENAAIDALTRFVRGPILSRRREVDAVGGTLESLDVKAGSLEAKVSSLSGGNQQKVVMARALLSQPLMLIADEPTQGVDVGARSEIYRILREVSASGIPVVVASSDAKELEGLCDHVIVMSRGHVVANLSGAEITEEGIISAAVTSTTHSVTVGREASRELRSTGFRRFIQGDYAPTALLGVVILALGTFIFTQNDRYISDFNITSMLTAVAALGFIALGQTIALLIGGIDLSVGPLAGFLVVVSSFFLTDEQPPVLVPLGLGLMLLIAVATGLLNGALIRFGKFTAIAATLATYIALQGLSFILRDAPEGYISGSITQVITTKLGPVPVAFIVLVALAVGLEWLLRRRRWGWRLRATGSSEESARRIGVRITPTVVLAYVAVAVLTFLGSLMLMARIGVGDPAQGVSYTLTSITAVVLGGTSLLGGRGTFLGTVVGALLLVQVLNATTFLGLDQTWQYLFQGILILAAAILYSIARARRKRRAA